MKQLEIQMTNMGYIIKPHLAQLIQNGFTGEARKTGFSRLLVHFNLGLQNGFMLPCIDLRKINKAEAGISRAKEGLNGVETLTETGFMDFDRFRSHPCPTVGIV